MRVLLAGESWMSHTIHVKGFDSFTTSTYEEGAGWLIRALQAGGHEVTYLRNHEAPVEFPIRREELDRYDVVILSDIGSNTLLLHPDTFARSRPTPNRLALLRDFVLDGGGLCMVGGYMTFSGIDGKGKYAGTPVEAVLPVTLEPADDRVETPEGVEPEVVEGVRHPVLEGLPARWPATLGHNRVHPKAGAEVLVRVGPDPLVVVGTYGRGRSLAFTTDCGPHWAPPEFVNWDGYARFWNQAVAWLGAGRAQGR